MKLKDTLENLEYLLSPRSLRLHEEYQSRIQVLRQLGYIDNDNLGTVETRQYSIVMFALFTIFRLKCIFLSSSNERPSCL